MIDYHVHSRRSGDSDASMSDACAVAVRRGLREICFTEHVDFEPTDECYGAFDYNPYLQEIAQVRVEFDGKLVIRCGIEVDFQSKYRSQIRDFLDGKQFDYVIGAAHYVDGVILEDHENYFPGKTVDQAYAPYFDNTLDAVETGWFDSLAHVDLCKRYGVMYLGPFDWTRFRKPIEDILDAIIRRGMSLEINTSGLRQAPGETYPSGDILARYREMGGRNIVVGSDAHRAEDVGSGIEDALALARTIGFDTVDTFDNRRRKQTAIQDMVSSVRSDP